VISLEAGFEEDDRQEDDIGNIAINLRPGSGGTSIEQ